MSYTVKPGDSLSIIAKKFGQPYAAWKQIYDLNPQIGANPDRIYPGQVLAIPSSWEGGQAPGQETPGEQITPAKKMDYTWIYWGGGILLLWLAYKKRCRK